MTPASFRCLVPRLHPRVLSYAAWMLTDPEEGRDVAQECFLRLWTVHDRVELEAARAWLLRTAHRLCIDRFRQPRLASATATAEVIAAAHPGPDEDLLHREEAIAIADALGQLGPAERALLLLREHQGLGYTDIATILGQPIGTVKSAVHRARRRLAETLESADAPQEASP